MQQNAASPLSPVSHDRVTIGPGFWARRMETNRTATLPIEYEQLKKTGRLDSLKMQWKKGDPNPPHIFWDSDIAKWIEAVGFSLASHPDPRLEALADETIERIAKAQQPDGYFNVHFTIVEPEKRWTNLRDWHELYCAGHLMEAAVAYFRGTGKRALLDAACRYADHIGHVFGPGEGQKRGYPGHEEIELALVKLYRETGERKYFDLAKYFIDERGRQPHYFELEALERDGKPNAKNLEYNQSHLPVREQSEAVGHAVRAMYLYSGMADVAAETDDAELAKACRRLWDSVTLRRMYVTGGVGSAHAGEAFTFDYDLPNEEAYAETCAAIGLIFFAHRMLHLELDGRYADAMETALYNGALAGVSLDGKRFFYVNPLAAAPGAGGEAKGAQRPEWFNCACCPPNIARLLASLGGYAFSESEGAGCVHLYMNSETALRIAGQRVGLRVETEYPWRETIRLIVAPERPGRFALAVRIPGWAQGAKAQVNGAALDLKAVTRKNYARIEREWRGGDEVLLTFPMPVERVWAHPNVRQDAGRTALRRGPLVYCLEEADNGKNLHSLALPDEADLSDRFEPDLLGGVVTLEGEAIREVAGPEWDGALYRSKPPRAERARIKAIPYYAWANRGPGEMAVWLRRA